MYEQDDALRARALRLVFEDGQHGAMARVGRQRIEKFRPFRGPARIRHVAGDDDGVDGIFRMDRVQQRKQPVESLISARTCPAALDPKAIALADNVNIRQVGDAPRPVSARTSRKITKIPKPGHGRVGEGPDERGDGEVCGDKHNTVGQRDGNQIARRSKIGDLSQQREPGQLIINTANAAAEMATPAAPAVPARTAASCCSLRRDCTNFSTSCRKPSRQTM